MEKPQSMPSFWTRNAALYGYKTGERIKVPSILICTILGKEMEDK
jgi:hypothetical protein